MFEPSGVTRSELERRGRKVVRKARQAGAADRRRAAASSPSPTAARMRAIR